MVATSLSRRRRFRFSGFCLVCIAFALPVPALDVDMDPVPIIPLRPGESQTFLIHLSKAKAACKGIAAFSKVPEGLEVVPPTQDFELKPGAPKLLVFIVKCTAWGEPTAIRPEIKVEGGESVNFPAILKTTILRDQKKFDKKALDEKGLRFYYSCGDGPKHKHNSTWADKGSGKRHLWVEFFWVQPGGVKGKCLRGANGDTKTKVAFSPFNNVDHRRGTILFWLRKEDRVVDIHYRKSKHDIGYDSTWKFGPGMSPYPAGEGIIGPNFMPQDVVRKRMKKIKDITGLQSWKPKKGSNSFIGLRRYKAHGDKEGYLEATYLAMRGRRYSVRAPYDWTGDWRHVALLWDTAARRLEIYLDGKRASDKVRTNGTDKDDAHWHGAPWDPGGFEDQATFGFVKHRDEGGSNYTRRDELYIYDRPLSPEDIAANMKASMGGPVPDPVIEPAGGPFHDALSIGIRSLWVNPVHRYTLDGSEPTEKSPIFKAPIKLDKSATLKVKSWLHGFVASKTVSATFEHRGPDKTPPKVCGVLAINDPKKLAVFFDKHVDPKMAADAKNYSLSGIEIKSAVMDQDGQTVRLELSQPLGAEARELSIKDIKDTTPSANAMTPHTEKNVRLRKLPGLVAWWGFDVLTGPKFKNLIAPNRYGTAYQAVNTARAERVEGRKGKALYLRGFGDFADVSEYPPTTPDSTNLNDKSVDRKSALHSDEATICFWIKAPPVEKPRRRCIIKKEYAYEVGLHGNNLMVTGSGGLRFIPKGKDAIPVADDKWHHVAFVFRRNVDNGTQVYVDGVLKGSFKAKFLNHSGKRLQLSAPNSWGSGACYLDGALDDVMFIKGALKAEDVRKLYTTGYLDE